MGTDKQRALTFATAILKPYGAHLTVTKTELAYGFNLGWWHQATLAESLAKYHPSNDSEMEYALALEKLAKGGHCPMTEQKRIRTMEYNLLLAEGHTAADLAPYYKDVLDPDFYPAEDYRSTEDTMHP